MQIACRRHDGDTARAGDWPFAMGAAIIKRRRMEQACGCSMVRGGQGLKVRARLSRSWAYQPTMLLDLY